MGEAVKLAFHLDRGGVYPALAGRGLEHRALAKPLSEHFSKAPRRLVALSGVPGAKVPQQVLGDRPDGEVEMVGNLVSAHLPPAVAVVVGGIVYPEGGWAAHFTAPTALRTIREHLGACLRSGLRSFSLDLSKAATGVRRELVGGIVGRELKAGSRVCLHIWMPGTKDDPSDYRFCVRCGKEKLLSNSVQV